MNHALIAEQALRYRNRMVADSFTAGRFDPAQAATMAVTSADPLVDTAIRRIATAWVDGGLDPEHLTEDWDPSRVDPVLGNDVTLLDAMDDIIRGAHRAQFRRPRQRSNSLPRPVRF